MKKKFLFLYIFLSIFAFCFVGFNPVVSADICDILITDFIDGDTSVGSDSGTVDMLSFINLGGANDFETFDGFGVVNPSFKIYTDGEGYWNLTYDFDYIRQINISLYMPSTAGDGNLHINFYDSNDNNVIRLRIDQDEDVIWVNGGGDTIVGAGAAATRYYLVITHLYSNYFNVSFLDAAYSWIDGEDSIASIYAGVWVDFEYMYLSCEGTTCTRYFDNFYINYCQTDEGFCDNIGVVVLSQDDEPGIRSTLLDTTVTYQYTIIGDVGAKAWLWITDQDTPSIPLHIKYLGEIPAVGILTGSHNIFYNSILYSEQIYSFIVKDYPILNPTCTNYFYEVQNFTMNSTTPYNFTQDYYAEFQYLKYNPALVGDSIDIVYCLPQNDTATDIFEDYYYLISLWRNKEMVDYKYMYVNLYKLNQTIFNNGGLGTFPSEGDYQLKVYNCSSFTGRSSYSHVYGLYYGTLFYESNELKVFKNIQAYWDYVEGTTQEHNDTEENIFSDIVDDDFAYIIGFVVCLVIACFVGYITMNGMAFASGFFGSLLIFSIPNQFFTMFPTIVLFICGLIIILLLVFMFISR